MTSRLWEGGRSPNNFVSSSSYSRNQAGRTNGSSGGQQQQQQQQSSSSGATAALSSRRTITAPPKDGGQSPAVAAAAAQTRVRRPRTPRSASAVKDGKKFLAAFREKRDQSNVSPAPPNGADVASSKPVMESLEVPPGLTDAFAQRLERYQSCAPSLARSLEAALAASQRGQHPSDYNHSSDAEENKGLDRGGPADTCSSSGSASGGSDGVGLQQGDDSSSAGASAEPSPKTAQSSPERLTPEVRELLLCSVALPCPLRVLARLISYKHRALPYTSSTCTL